ncbi:MAG: Transcriptional regulator MntR [Lentisphaerae bacterium ADurb.BinA184]|nr:MAG: Transcriptional regulator MntR [Lentisphaerae bacterium ADurb.BinA184]
MAETDALTASLEDYLEAILRIERSKRAARAKDIADALHVHSSSVTGALRALARRRLVNYAPYDLVTLTPGGRRRAADVAWRHEVLRGFLVNVLNLDDGVADTGACRLEHAIPPEVLRRLILFIEALRAVPSEHSGWLRDFERQCHDGRRQESGPRRPRTRKDAPS